MALQCTWYVWRVIPILWLHCSNQNVRTSTQTICEEKRKLWMCEKRPKWDNNERNYIAFEDIYKNRLCDLSHVLSFITNKLTSNFHSFHTTYDIRSRPWYSACILSFLSTKTCEWRYINSKTQFVWDFLCVSAQWGENVGRKKK